MLPLRNEMIMASAGAGKTYALVSRFVNLLLHGQNPEHLVALTFSRKAAGEFFDKIFERLADAITDEQKRAELEEQLTAPGEGGISAVSIEDLTQALRRMAESMPRLHLGTLDSLFVQILQTFYLEFGFSAGFSLLTSAQIDEERRRACESVFRTALQNKSDHDFLQAFRSATFGAEEKSMLGQLLRFVAEHYGDFQSGAGGEKWGGEHAIWPDGCPWLQEPRPVNEVVVDLLAAVESDSQFTAAAIKAWRITVAEFAAVTPEHRLEKLTGLNGHLLGNAQSLRAGTATIMVSRKNYAPTPDQCRHASELVHHVLYCEIIAAQHRTHGIWQILNTFDIAYRRDVRSTGKLTFDDVQRLLAGFHTLSQSGGESDTNPAENGYSPQETLLHIGYRLDAHLHHWMLDEFQDTSRVQWRILQNLIDEAVTHGDPEERSLFYVGDVKQSIYGWRGGDHRLFRQIGDHYNSAGSEIVHKVPLDKSWRCAQPVINTVNRVFQDTQVLQTHCGNSIAGRWSETWTEHTTAVDAPGYGAFISMPRPQGARGRLTAPDNRHFAMALALIEEVDPLSRGLTCAVLVRTNPDGQKVTSYIRDHSRFEVEREAECHPVVDNPLGSAFLSLFKAAFHPSDTLSWQHLRLTPFRQCLDSLGWDQCSFIRETLAAIHRDGFEPVIRQWLRHLRDALQTADSSLDAFSEHRGESLCDAAAEFDASGSRDGTRFVSFLESYTEREASSEGRIQVMTVHKAKGLEFDMVIVLELGNADYKYLGRQPFAAAHEEEEVFHASHDEAGGLRWALDMPRKSIAEADPVLRQYLEEKGADQGYENICLTYVAMTRAKHGLYLVTDDLPNKPSSFNFSRFLHETLAEKEVAIECGSRRAKGTCRFETGNPEWFKHTASSTEDEQPKVGTPSSEVSLRPLTKPALPAIKPSGYATAAHGDSELRSTSKAPADESAASPVQEPGHTFLRRTRKSANALGYGTAVHALFEQITWLDDFVDDTAALRSRWESSLLLDPGIKEQAYAEVLACLQQSDIAKLFSKTSFGDTSLLLRERSFSQIIDGHVLSGVFDRVAITLDTTGRPISATIIDFKTDKVDGAEEVELATASHRPQMLAYRNALAALLGLQPSSITITLVFTKRAQVAKVAS